MQPASKSQSDTFTILVAEDDPIAQLDLCEVLEQAGSTVVAVQKAAEAIAVAEATSRLDLAILDIDLADGSDGITVANALRERWGILSVFASGNLEGETLDRALRAGPVAILRKPYTEAALQRALMLVKDALDPEDPVV